MQPMFNDMIALARDLAFSPVLAVAMARKSNDTGYECARCGAEMSPERDDCRPCPRCGRDNWLFDADMFGTGVFAPDGGEESHYLEYAKCRCCGLMCDPDDLEVTDDSKCPRCFHVGAPVDIHEDTRPDRDGE